MRRLLLILLIVTAGLDAFAAGYRVRGRVTDATGAPLPGSVVHLDENYLWAVTDLDGKFVLEGVEAGSYQLKTECLGFVSGGKTVNPDLTASSELTVRGGGSGAGNAAFGTAVEVNGVRMGDNAAFGGLAGVDTRSLQVENIESVEVISGVPSAEYGDLGSGMVKVTTRKGRTPVQATFSVNPRTYDVSVSKGIGIGEGVLNVSGQWTRATQKLTSPYTSYTRRGFTAEYSRTFARTLRLEAGVTGNLGGMDSKDDPDAFSEEYAKAHDNLLTPHLKLTWMLSKSWITNLSLEGSVYYHDNRTHDTCTTPTDLRSRPSTRKKGAISWPPPCPPPSMRTASPTPVNWTTPPPSNTTGCTTSET